METLMADWTWGSDDYFAMADEARADAAQSAWHDGHVGLTLENAEACYDCGRDVVNYPEEFLVGDDELFWAVIDEQGLEPSEFAFVFQPQLAALGLA